MYIYGFLQPASAVCSSIVREREREREKARTNKRKRERERKRENRPDAKRSVNTIECTV